MNNNKTTSNKNGIPKISNGVNKFFQSKTFKRVTLGVAAFIIILIIFGIGTFVGFKKANFSFKWGENYHQNFAGPRGGFFGDFGGGFLKDFEGRDFINAHGVIGQIIKIDGSTIAIEGKDNAEKIILIENNTMINRFRETIKSSDLKVDNFIVVIGEPNDAGQIVAKLIRLLPQPPVKTPLIQ